MALPALKELFPEHFFVNPDLTSPPPPQSIITNEIATVPNAPPVSAMVPPTDGTDSHSNIDPALLENTGHIRTGSSSISTSIQPQPQPEYRTHGQQQTQAQEQKNYHHHERLKPQHPHHRDQPQQQNYPPPAFPLSQVRPRAVAKRRFETTPPPPPPQELEFAHVQFDNYPPYGSGPGAYPYQQRRQQYAGHAHDPQTEVQRSRALTNPALANPSLNPSYLPGAGGHRRSRSGNGQGQGGPGEFEQHGYAQGQREGHRRNRSMNVHRGGNSPTTAPSNGRVSGRTLTNNTNNARSSTHTRRISDVSVSDLTDVSDGASDGSDDDDEYYNGNARRGGDGEGDGEDDALKRRHPCPRCGKRFNRPSSLKIHLNTHTGDKPYECPFPGCGRSFNVSSNMRRHYRNHSRRDTPPPLPANAYPVVSREQQMMNNEAYPAMQRRGGSHASGEGGGGGYRPYGGGMHPSQYTSYGYMHPGSYMGMGGMGMTGMGGGMGMGMGLGGGMDGIPPHPSQMSGMGMHPGEMGMHPGMGMYPGMAMGINPGHWMGMGMGANGMNGVGSMGNGGTGGLGGFGGGGMEGIGGHGSWGPPVSNTRGDREAEGEKTRGVGLGISDAQAENNDINYTNNSNGIDHGKTNGPRTGTQPGGNPADPPTPPYTNEPPSPPPVLRSDSVWDEKVMEDEDTAGGGGAKRASNNVIGDAEDGRPQKRARVGMENGREGEVVYYGASDGAGGPKLGDVVEGGGAINTKPNQIDRGTADNTIVMGSKNGGLCQPSPETPSMRNLDALGEEEEGDDGDASQQHKYRHAESHMRQSSNGDALATMSSSTSHPENTHNSNQHLHPHSRTPPPPSSGPIPAATSDLRMASSDEGTYHARYFPGPATSLRDDEGVVGELVKADAGSEEQLQPLYPAAMPFPCYTFPPPMPMPLPLPTQSSTTVGIGAGGMGVPPPGMPSLSVEPPMAGLGPPPPGEGDPPLPLSSSLDNKGLVAAVADATRAFSVCPPARTTEGLVAGMAAGAGKAGRARVGLPRADDDIDPTLR